MLLPDPLFKNGTIGILALSDPVFKTEVADWVNRGVEFLKGMNFNISLGSTLFKKRFYTSGTAQERWTDLKKMIQNPDIKVIMTAIGGENAHQILPLIDFDLIKQHPKIIIGYSDPTVILNPISEICNIPTFYGPHAISFDPKWDWHSKYTVNCFKKLLMNYQNSFKVPASGPRESWQHGTAKGRLVGGCLIDLMKLLSTPWEPNWEERILILESVYQSPQNIDVYLTHLRQVGVFNKIKGLILGKFHHSIKHTKESMIIKDIFKDVLSDTNFPILKTEDFGHSSNICPFPLGAMCEVDATNKSITFLEPVVKDLKKCLTDQ